IMTVTKEAEMGTKPRKPAAPEPASTSSETELPERWSVQQKFELVLRLLRGEALDAVSRESQVPAHELESWQRIFLDKGPEGFRPGASPRNASSCWPAPRSAS